VDVRVGACNGDDAVRRSIEAAVYKSSPLPPPPDPSLFERELLFKFEPE
jgi:colicin import membrane protein